MLKASGVDYKIVEYLKNPPSEKELKTICKGLDMNPVDLVRTKDKRFKELGLSKNDKRSQEEWVTLMVSNPSIIERPIVAYEGKYAMGRPPESIKDFLQDS